MLNIAYNLLAGGTCLEHLELLRSDEAYLDALGARRIPDPTTAGDFCRRFDAADIFRLQEIFNATRMKVWRQQPKAFFEEAIIDADGTMAETTGECKEGMDINYKGQWGYHPLVLSLANTGEPFYVVNRSGNRPSHEQAAFYFDRAIALCRRAGFQKIRLRGDTDFTQTEHLDRWDAASVQFIFGIDATKRLYEMAGELPENAWKTLLRRAKHEVKTQPRRRPENVKQQVVEAREFEDIRLVKEHVAEFRYRPVKCRRSIAWWSCGRNWMSTRARRSCLTTRVASSTSPTTGRSPPRRSSSRPTTAATRRTSARNSRATCVRCGAGGQPVVELGVHGDGLAGLEPEGLGGVAAAGGGPLAAEASRRRSGSCCGWTSARFGGR